MGPRTSSRRQAPPLLCGVREGLATVRPSRLPLPDAHRLARHSASKAREPPGTPSSSRTKWHTPLLHRKLPEYPVLHCTRKHRSDRAKPHQITNQQSGASLEMPTSGNRGPKNDLSVLAANTRMNVMKAYGGYTLVTQVGIQDAGHKPHEYLPTLIHYSRTRMRQA